jgi:hypothetical protein
LPCLALLSSQAYLTFLALHQHTAAIEPPGAPPLKTPCNKKNAFSFESHSMLTMIILPRQARDKHREKLT